MHTLAPREVLNYTWDDPEGKKFIRWNFPSATKIRNRKVIEVIKVIESLELSLLQSDIGSMFSKIWYNFCFSLRIHKLVSV